MRTKSKYVGVIECSIMYLIYKLTYFWISIAYQMIDKYVLFKLQATLVLMLKRKSRFFYDFLIALSKYLCFKVYRGEIWWQYLSVFLHLLNITVTVFKIFFS